MKVSRLDAFSFNVKLAAKEKVMLELVAKEYSSTEDDMLLWLIDDQLNGYYDSVKNKE